LAILGFVIGAAIFYIVGQSQRRKDAAVSSVDVERRAPKPRN